MALRENALPDDCQATGSLNLSPLGLDLLVPIRFMLIDLTAYAKEASHR